MSHSYAALARQQAPLVANQIRFCADYGVDAFFRFPFFWSDKEADIRGFGESMLEINERALRQVSGCMARSVEPCGIGWI